MLVWHHKPEAQYDRGQSSWWPLDARLPQNVRSRKSMTYHLATRYTRRQSRDFSEIVGQINESAKLIAKLGMVFLLFEIYAAIVLGSTSHEQLLRGTGALLPVLNIALPISGIYLVVPLLFSFLHFYLLMQCFLLSRKLHRFALEHTKLGACAKESVEEIFYPFPLIYIILGIGKERLARYLIGLMVWLPFVLLPPTLLFLMQARFLPYHSREITNVHRVILMLDIGFLIWVCPKILSMSGRWLVWWRTGLNGRSWLKKIVVLAQRSLVFISATTVVGCSWVVVTLPGEWNLPFGDRLFFGENKPLLYRNLVVTGQTIVQEAPAPELLAEYERAGKDHVDAWLKYSKGIDLKNRDLRLADLNQSRLVNADLRGADLRGANLVSADFRHADLRGADLRGADLTLADLTVANLSDAKLAYAVFAQGSSHGYAAANLQGATLYGAYLDGAFLGHAKLQGADFGSTSMRCVDLGLANLQGANFRYSRLDGSSLFLAQLQGANMDHTSLYGTDLRKARFKGTSFKFTYLGNAHFEGSTFVLCEIRPNIGPERSVDWSKFRSKHESEISGLKLALRPANGIRLDLWCSADAEKMSQANPEKTEGVDQGKPMGSLVQGKVDQQKLISYLVELACSNRYVAMGLATRADPPGTGGDEWPLLARSLLSQHCEAIRSLPSEVRQNLERIAYR